METKHRRVVITGIGPVTAMGTGKDLLWDNLLAARVNIREIPQQFETNYRFKSRFYVPFPETPIEEYGLPGRFSCLMEPSTRAAVIAARLALEDAGIPWHDNGVSLPVPSGRCMILLGTGICSLQAGFAAHQAHALDPAQRYNRMVIPMIMPDSATSWISILAGIRGGNCTLNASCASGTVAIGEAWRNIRDGHADMALAGGVECLHDDTGTIMRGFDGLGTLTTSQDGLPRPFSLERSGFLFAEGGACILVLETYENAVARGAGIMAEILDYACCSDAFNIVQMEPEGREPARMTGQLAAGRRIDYFNAHGTATQLNDETEARTLQTVFGRTEEQPLISSTKGMCGHSIGASGAIEAAVTALSIERSMVHRNLGGTPMEGLNLALGNRPVVVETAISASYGFGGHNAALLLGKVK